jgi:hypothetical protein
LISTDPNADAPVTFYRAHLPVKFLDEVYRPLELPSLYIPIHLTLGETLIDAVKKRPFVLFGDVWTSIDFYCHHAMTKIIFIQRSRYIGSHME